MNGGAGHGEACRLSSTIRHCDLQGLAEFFSFLSVFATPAGLRLRNSGNPTVTSGKLCVFICSYFMDGMVGVDEKELLKGPRHS